MSPTFASTEVGSNARAPSPTLTSIFFGGVPTLETGARDDIKKIQKIIAIKKIILTYWCRQQEMC